MAQTLTAHAAGNPVQMLSGAITGDATTVTLSLGFQPKFMRIVNLTDTIVWEYVAGMAAGNLLKLTGAADEALDTNGYLTFDTAGRTATISGTLAASGKSLVWIAMG